MFVFPSMTMPASSRRADTVASYGATKLSSMREPQLVFTPSVQKMSLWAYGTPVNGPARPAARSASAARACSSARSGHTVM